MAFRKLIQGSVLIPEKISIEGIFDGDRHSMSYELAIRVRISRSYRLAVAERNNTSYSG
jgi:hypothetical protein